MLITIEIMKISLVISSEFLPLSPLQFESNFQYNINKKTFSTFVKEITQKFSFCFLKLKTIDISQQYDDI